MSNDRITAMAEITAHDGEREKYVIVFRESQQFQALQEIIKWILNPELRFNLQDGMQLQTKIEREAMDNAQKD